MSTEIYLTCQTCKKRILIGQDGLSGFTFYSGEPECMKALNAFMGEHISCGEHSGDRMQVDMEGFCEDCEDVEWSP